MQSLARSMSTFAIIGHGASPTGRGWGARIDDMPVVRLHDWHWQDTDDYGRRCDYAVLPGPWIEKAVRQAVRAPAVSYLVYKLPTQRPKAVPATVLGAPTRVFVDEPAAIYRHLAPQRPTRGLLACVMAQALGARELVLVGLDMVTTGVFSPYALRHPYPTLESDMATCTAHDMAAESAILRVWAAAAGVRLIVAGEGWPV